ncbi:DNA helicase II [Escherichia coli]|nr:DNA helicase II [Escherichia coli]
MMIALFWYDIPVGRKNRHPDFVIIDPDNGLVFLEVKDWTVSTLRKANSGSRLHWKPTVF